MKLPTERTIGVTEWRRNPRMIALRISKPLRFRLWLSLQLIRLAARIACYRIDVDFREAEP